MCMFPGQIPAISTHCLVSAVDEIGNQPFGIVAEEHDLVSASFIFGYLPLYSLRRLFRLLVYTAFLAVCLAVVGSMPGGCC